MNNRSVFQQKSVLKYFVNHIKGAEICGIVNHIKRTEPSLHF